MRRNLAALLLMAYAPVFGQEGQLQSNFRREANEIKKNCPKTFGCLETMFTGEPMKIAVGSIAPGNGVGFGPAFVYDKNFTRVRLNTNADAVATMNGSWRAGVYLKAILTPNDKIGITTKRPKPGAAPQIESLPVPEFNFYAQATSLNKLSYYGEGPFSSRQSLAFYGMTETVTGANVIYPIFGNSGVSLFGELNGRFLSLRGRHGDKSPSIEQLYTEVSAPGLLRQPGYLQAGEGIRFDRGFAGARLNLQYRLTFQEFVAGSGPYSFRRLNIDALHEFPLYRNQRRLVTSGSDAVGPDQSPDRLKTARYNTRNLEGSVTLRALLTESYIPKGNVVPFYYQPTLGGTDINGAHALPSYPDYRFRAPNVLLFRGTFEHSIWGPLGGLFTADYGRVALTHGDLAFNHFRHSYGVGVTIRAGGLPAVSLVFAFGGKEGTHTIADISPALLGSTARPSLY